MDAASLSLSFLLALLHSLGAKVGQISFFWRKLELRWAMTRWDNGLKRRDEQSLMTGDSMDQTWAGGNHRNCSM